MKTKGIGNKAGWNDEPSEDAVLLSYLAIMGSSLGLMKEKPLKAVWSMESMRFLSAWERRGFSFRNSRSKLLQSLGDFCWWQVRNLVRFK